MCDHITRGRPRSTTGQDPTLGWGPDTLPRAGRGWTAGKGSGREGREAAADPHCSSCRTRVILLSRRCRSGSHTAQCGGGGGHRVALSGPGGQSREIPAPALPSPPPRSPGRGGGNASRAQTPPPPPPSPPPCLLLPPPPRDRPYPQPGEEEAGAEPRGPLPAPCGWKHAARGHDGRPARPGRPQAAPEHLRAPAGPRALSAPLHRILPQKHVK